MKPGPGLQSLPLAHGPVPDGAPEAGAVLLLERVLVTKETEVLLLTLPGRMERTLEVRRSVASVRLSSGSECPSLYQRISGLGDPPWLEQVRLMETPSVATGVRGEMTGGPGFTNTVTKI